MDKPKQAEPTCHQPRWDKLPTHSNVAYPEVIKTLGKQKLRHILGPSSDTNISNQQDTKYVGPRNSEEYLENSKLSQR